MSDARTDYSRLAEVVGGLGLHEHLCVIYDTQEDQFAAALPYLRSGLEGGERCLYIVDENTAAAVLDALRRGGTDVDHYLRSGALTIAHKQETYLKQGRFDPDWMIGFLTQATAEAGAARFSGLRTLLGEMTWALGTGDGTGKLIEYESKLNRFVRDHDARVICQYNRARFSPEVILGVIRTHPLVVYGSIVCKNPYYVPPDEFLKPHQAAQEVDRLLNNILAWERAQQALRDSEDRLRHIIDTIPTMAWSVRPDGAVDFLNQVWLDYTGLSLEEGLEEPTRVMHPEDSPRVMEKWLADMAAGEPFEDELRLRRADGEYRWFLVRTVPLRDEAGNIVKWYGSSIDIEDRKRAMQEIESLRRQLELERDYLREELDESQAFGEILGRSEGLHRVLSQIQLVAPTEASVLILGETGTGKELVARAIHQRSPRSSRPLIKVNCGSIPRELFESEFFGHVKGAFTGALRDRVGRFELADRGTLFLDEVSEIPLELQSKLLRVLQEGEFERVGEESTRRVNVRVIAATNRDLQSEVEAGRFRLDLFHRLAVFPIQIPPLRERREDIPILSVHFVEQICSRSNLPRPRLRRGDMEALERYDWPGNVRELQNVIERAVILARGGPLQIDLALAGSPAAQQAEPAHRDQSSNDDEDVLTEQEWREKERENLQKALQRAGGRISGPGGAAEMLGLHPNTLAYRLKILGLTRKS